MKQSHAHRAPTLARRAGWLLLTLAVCAALAIAGAWVSAPSAHGVEIDTTDDRVHISEVRYTYVGEFRRDVLDRIGPVHEVKHRCNDDRTRCSFDYEMYRPRYFARIAYFVPTKAPFTQQRVGALQVRTWSIWHCPQRCEIAQ